MLLERAETTDLIGHAPSAAVPSTPTVLRLPAAVAPARGTARWVRRHRAGLVLGEALIAASAAAVVLLAHDGPVLGSVLAWAGLSLVAAWPALLAVTGAYEERWFGVGSDEFRRVGRAGLLLLAGMGFVSYAAELDLSRALVVLAVPALTAATLVGRYAARRVLHRRRMDGRCVKRVVVVGRGGAALDLVDRLHHTRHAGLEVVGLCVTPDDRARVARVAGLPVAGLDDVLGLAGRVGADTIAVTSASETASQYLRTLSWQLEGSGLELLVAPGLVEVAGPRLHIRPFDGLPLLSVEQPRFEGWRRVVKGALDRSVASAALLLLAPVLLALALAVRLSGPGPVLYRQQRVGLGGQHFTMLKFRSMVVGADQQVAGLAAGNEADGLLFKMRQDPRVTPVGRWMRRLSLDELPQLVNVLIGDMSLVGPRPPLPDEVARYDTSVSRRLLVKPGLTGLWQISGRSDLPWEEAVRLDLRYVENWSLALDVQILWKTARAVVSASGAY
ncbi:sugar transferase [Modestobacter marinus]|uniref:Exopolysaccharide biosynthesis polyprenyl glycosylphosphotransferase n=1 Tax=Modestobacter marinus TaxID=477641 RepID=A0A846LE63_9ACTN|nr:sugar transferase [Modestobacter marinus]NIH65937.1 exopolysaccharide biosynthesis polyprenyl glycosylphosphotransferase [Modestobacter marinus]GGL68256.1 exopolysaccharide biosynthesis polyprenyl glycosylphosphotransferase [Modestobacter marinus]